MANAADAPLRMIGQQIWADLQPFEGRLALTWRVALLCALAAGTAMMHRLPESAISCYLIIFLMRPNAAECVIQALGLIVLATLLVLGLAPVIQALAEAPLLRIVTIAAASFVFLWLGSASQLGEIGSIIGLVIAFILTMVDLIPVGEIATRGLLYAWAMACMPMAWMAGFCLVLGTGPHTLVRRTVARRLEAAAALLAHGDRRPALELAAEGQTEVDKRMMMAQLLHTAPKAETQWLGGAAASAWRALFAAGALAGDVSQATREALARQCLAAAAAVRAGRRPEPPAPDAGADAQAKDHPALAVLRAMLAGLSRPDGGSVARPARVPLLAPDAFTNPEHQQFALKTTAAALLAYFTYSLLAWEGIATAMVTCYVASLGTTGETTHKLTLRICGCLIGAAMGVGAIMFVIPHLTSVGGLMALVFLAILPAVWVAAGSERISYGGVQIGLAFLLTVLGGFRPDTSMSAASDRIIGILLGNTMVFVMFTNFWPKSAVVEVRRQLAEALRALARVAAAAPGSRDAMVNDIATATTMTGKARYALDMTPFEPHGLRPAAAELRPLYGVVNEIAAILPAIVFSPERLDAVARRLDAAAERLEAAAPPVGARRTGQTPAPPPDGAPPAGPAPADIDARATRIGLLAAGGAA
ncbi:FUSC family protein [Camelimonas abortus]|uniref:FUSC family protein n=1 Tax=Camelimonas abortus TaxID=1017184 RepID=A0ABV7LCE2_9HYPH